MIHFRKIIFDMLDLGMNPDQIREAIIKDHHMEIPVMRIQNYHDVHTKVRNDAVARQKFLDGKLDLLGNPL